MPHGFLEQVLEARAYERAHDHLRLYPKGPKTGLVATAEQVMFAIVQADMDAKKQSR